MAKTVWEKIEERLAENREVNRLFGSTVDITICQETADAFRAASRSLAELEKKFAETIPGLPVWTKEDFINMSDRTDGEDREVETLGPSEGIENPRPARTGGLSKAAEDIMKKKGDKTMARKAAKTTSPFKKGRAKVSRGSGSQFLGIKADESIVFAPLVGLDEMVSADMHEYWDITPAIYHPCIGRDCPGCEVGNDSRFKGYLPVILKATGDVAVYPFTVSVYNQLESLEDELDEDQSLKGFVIKISRKGSGLKTRYTVLGTGRTIDVSGAEIPDFIPQLGPQTADEIWELLEDNGFSRGPEAPKHVEDTDEKSDDDDWGDV